jgi:Asp-tRNA(Asn)/Glu-tRNA(Gln) amidotransferase A subunit family amidase
VEARRRIGTKELSPVELLDACISRIEQVNPAVNAVTATDFGRAREAAQAAEASRPGRRSAAVAARPAGRRERPE